MAFKYQYSEKQDDVSHKKIHYRALATDQRTQITDKPSTSRDDCLKFSIIT